VVNFAQFERFPKDRYQTEVESWRLLQSANIEFTMKAAAGADWRPTMPTKEKRTAAELEELIITEFKKRPELNNILSVIVSPELPTPGGPTWECHRVSDEVTMRKTIADEIIRKLQDKFDLL
jgi:hypothetical protein